MHRVMTEDEITEYIVSNFTGVDAIRPETAGGPEIAHGDRFFMYNPDPEQAPKYKFPFATIVTKDYGDFDNTSRLDRDGVFRLNIGVGNEIFRSIIGSPPSSADDGVKSAQSVRDYSVLDKILPHPVYANLSWICILNPSDETFHELIAPLLAEAYQIAVRQETKRKPASGSER